jgi:hypothetical protein
MGDIIIEAAIFALLSSIYIASGLRILTAKRPFIISQWRQVIFGFAPTMAVYIYIYALSSSEFLQVVGKMNKLVN